MKISKTLYNITLTSIFLLIFTLTIVFANEYYNTFEFYKNIKIIFLSLTIAGVLILNYRRKYDMFILKNQLISFSLCLLTIFFLSFFINKLIITGFKEKIIIYNQILSVIFGLISFGLFVYLHFENLKNEKVKRN